MKIVVRFLYTKMPFHAMPPEQVIGYNAIYTKSIYTKNASSFSKSPIQLAFPHRLLTSHSACSVEFELESLASSFILCSSFFLSILTLLSSLHFIFILPQCLPIKL